MKDSRGASGQALGNAGLHCRVCRPIGLAAADVDALIGFVMARLGHQYDLKNVIDLAAGFDHWALAWHDATRSAATLNAKSIPSLQEAA